MKTKQEPMTHHQAIEQYYGGLVEIAIKPFPWKCKCGHKGALSVTDIFAHVKDGHGEKLKG